MPNRIVLFPFLVFALMQCAAGAVVRVADGDCAGLSAAASSAPGTEPSLIVLANKGHYGTCQLTVSGNIEIDGAGATIALRSISSSTPNPPSQLFVQEGGSLTLRNVNFGPQTAPGSGAAKSLAATKPPGNPSQIFIQNPLINNLGNLVLDGVSLSGLEYGVSSGFLASAMMLSSGSVAFRNVTFAGNGLNGYPMLASDGAVEVANSTFANNPGSASVFAPRATSTVTVANSLIVNSGATTCRAGSSDSPSGKFSSLGGNIISDDSCGFRQPGDRVVADAGLGAFGDNGGLVNTVLLNGSSVAVRNGIAANCEASDARGVVRNVAARGGCDSGAYEFGGGRGLLSQSGMSGFFYDASADGHYVTVQRLDWGSALVIWNTFDRNGQAAWIYSIGEVSGNHVHAQGAQNLGGVLQPGGAPTGSHGMVWGDIDIDLQNCFGGTFSYNSPLPNFGSGHFPLNRLAFLGDLDCSD